jgi:hypothetical protein
MRCPLQFLVKALPKPANPHILFRFFVLPNV